MTTTASDFLTIEELVTRLKMSEKTIEALARTEQFPLHRMTPKGTVYAFWSEVESWLRKRKF